VDDPTKEDYFRGDKAVKELSRDVGIVADILNNRPESTTITIYKDDYERLQRWPQAAERAGFTFQDSVPHFRRFRLVIAARPAPFALKEESHG